MYHIPQVRGYFERIPPGTLYIDLRKARERELATLDEKSTSSGIAEPCMYVRYKLKARTEGEKGRHL